MELTNIKSAYHRNGSDGAGFHVFTFNMKDDGEKKKRNMVAILFPNEGECAVLDIDETSSGNIEFANGNSWRGDRIEGALRSRIVE